MCAREQYLSRVYKKNTFRITGIHLLSEDDEPDFIFGLVFVSPSESDMGLYH